MQNSDLLGIIPIIFGLMFFVLFIGSLVWAYGDAENRGKSGCLWSLIIWFTWPLGLIAYIILRDRDVRL